MNDIKIIRGGRLVDIDRHEAPATDILLRGDEIIEIGGPGLAAPPDAEIIDAEGYLMHAGLVNGHTHGHGNLAKGMGDRWSLELLLTAGPWISGGRELEDKRLTTAIGAVEMLLKGCTAAYDLTFEFPGPTREGMAAAADAYTEVGMRCVLAPMVADISFFEAIPGLMQELPAHLQKAVGAMKLDPAENTLAAIRDVVENWGANAELVRPAVAPTIPHHCSNGFLTGCRDIAHAHGIGLHSHVAESKVQVIAGRRLYGKSLLAHMDDMGLVGSDFVVAHGVWLDDDDMKRLAAKGGHVCHNAGSNAILGNGIAYARRMLELGVNLAIGTDGANCSDNQNMYEAMRAALYMSHVRGPDIGHWLSTSEILRAATEGGAKALGLEKIGRIAPGYKADIVFLDLGHVNWIPYNDPVNQIVQTEDGSGVRHVMVGGEFVVRDRTPVNVDMAALARDAEAARARLEVVNAERKALFKQLSPIVSSFCPGLTKEPHHIQRFAAH